LHVKPAFIYANNSIIQPWFCFSNYCTFRSCQTPT